MKINQVGGDDPSIIRLIGKYAMNPNVIREMKGYPILTDENTVWFTAFSSKSLIGFGAITIKGEAMLFTNDYTIEEHRGKGVNLELIKKRVEYCKAKGFKKAIADCTHMSVKNYVKCGFKVVKEFKEWTKVELEL